MQILGTFTTQKCRFLGTFTTQKCRFLDTFTTQKCRFLGTFTTYNCKNIKLISQKTKKHRLSPMLFLIMSKSDYPKNEIKIPAATAEPITPDTLDDIQ